MIPKFRAFYKPNKKMYKVLTLDIIDKKALIKNTDDLDKPLKGYAKWEEMELMQSTGLKDKNGKEIFEGDILDFVVYNFYDGSDKRLKGKMIYKYASFILQTLNTKEEYDLFRVLLDDEEVEILGNIYENPELMEVGE